MPKTSSMSKASGQLDRLSDVRFPVAASIMARKLRAATVKIAR